MYNFNIIKYIKVYLNKYKKNIKKNIKNIKNI